MQWVGLSPLALAPTAVWRRRPRTTRWPRGSSYAACQAAAASPSSDANSSSNSRGEGQGEGGDRAEGEGREGGGVLLYEELEVRHAQAVARRGCPIEEYKEAVRLRDALRSFEEEELVLRLRRLLKNAVEEERFEDAVKYRDELQILAPHSLLKCSSDATTLE